MSSFRADFEQSSGNASLDVAQTLAEHLAGAAEDLSDALTGDGAAADANAAIPSYFADEAGEILTTAAAQLGEVMLASISVGEEVIIEADGFAVAARKSDVRDSLLDVGLAEVTEQPGPTTTPDIRTYDDPTATPSGSSGWVGFAIPKTLPGLEGLGTATAKIIHFPQPLRPNGQLPNRGSQLDRRNS